MQSFVSRCVVSRVFWAVVLCWLSAGGWALADLSESERRVRQAPTPAEVRANFERWAPETLKAVEARIPLRTSATY